MAVDWEERVNFDRLRSYRLQRAREALDNSDLGALQCFETSNIRYLTGTHIGYWAWNKAERYALLTRTGEIAQVLADEGVADEALGVDIVEMPILQALQDQDVTECATASGPCWPPGRSRATTRSCCSARPARWSADAVPGRGLVVTNKY